MALTFQLERTLAGDKTAIQVLKTQNVPESEFGVRANVHNII